MGCVQTLAVDPSAALSPTKYVSTTSAWPTPVAKLSVLLVRFATVAIAYRTRVLDLNVPAINGVL